MGACAITAVAATTWLKENDNNLGVVDIHSFIKSIAILCWAVATWWIPLIVLLEGWRYLKKGSPLQYTVGFWSMVFPLGMYAVCTFQLQALVQLSFLSKIATVFYYVALLAWVFTFIAQGLFLVRQQKNARE